MNNVVKIGGVNFFTIYLHSRCNILEPFKGLIFNTTLNKLFILCKCTYENYNKILTDELHQVLFIS